MTPRGLDASGPLCSELPSSPDTTVRAGKTHSATPPVGLHARGRGPGDSFSLPYFAVDDLARALEQVEALGGSVVHPGSASAVCRTPREARLG
jgi:predicted enzyme related to lactoylglutathione lyase